MFEMPVVRVAIVDGQAARVVPGETVDYSVSLTRDSRTMVYRAVEGRNTGDLFVHDLATGARRQLTDVNPETGIDHLFVDQPIPGGDGGSAAALAGP